MWSYGLVTFSLGNGCMFLCTMIYKPVCGHDGIVYPSECAMRGAACRKGEAIIAVQNGDKNCGGKEMF